MKRRSRKTKQKERYSHIRKLYDAFTIKDMTFQEFKKAYERETSPRAMRNELKELVRFRGHQRTQRLVAAQAKEQIDQKLSEN